MWKVLLLLLSLPISAQAATYQCKVEFGERVPIHKIVLKSNHDCTECRLAGAKIPVKSIDPNLSTEWNPDVEASSTLSSKVKREAIEHEGRLILLDTRYAIQKGKDFSFEMNCSPATSAKSVGKCNGRLTNSKSPTHLSSETPSLLFDQRIKPNRGHFELTLGNREHLGFIVRVFKKAVPLKGGKSISLSSSGELKFFSEEPNFILDVGVDEQLHLMGDLHSRIAALEVKIHCRR